jgi:hypothetical protein
LCYKDTSTTIIQLEHFGANATDRDGSTTGRDDLMLQGRTYVLGLTATVLLSVVGILAQAVVVNAADEKKEPNKRTGTVVGALTAKGENWVEVRADGEEKARRYVPHWIGGAPKDGGGPDKKVVAIIRKLKVGSRVRLEWEFEERPRVLKVDVLKEPSKP